MHANNVLTAGSHADRMFLHWPPSGRREAAPGPEAPGQRPPEGLPASAGLRGCADRMEAREVQRLPGPADRRRLPLLEDEDLTGEAVIEPSRLIRPVDAPAAAVACFFRDVVEELSGRQDARPVCRLHSEMGPASLWEIEHRVCGWVCFIPESGRRWPVPCSSRSLPAEFAESSPAVRQGRWYRNW